MAVPVVDHRTHLSDAKCRGAALLNFKNLSYFVAQI